MSNRALTWGGLAVAGGVGYYFYQAGGDPKVAQKKLEADAARASAEVKSHIPGATKQAQKDAELGISQVGSKLKELGKDAQAEAAKAEAKLDQYRKDAAAQLDKTAKDVHASTKNAIDTFDQKVTEGASKAKSGVSSWFGGK